MTKRTNRTHINHNNSAYVNDININKNNNSKEYLYEKRTPSNHINTSYSPNYTLRSPNVTTRYSNTNNSIKGNNYFAVNVIDNQKVPEPRNSSTPS